ncbi:MAG: cadherin repeat domain-containing protein, partial [Neisseriaceae bacterium]|nr:cadherin repeat domain-containing protein [Neisseriaceae bacterium]
MSLQFVDLNTQFSVSLEAHNQITIPIKDKHQYELQGEVPEDLTANRQGDDLILTSESEDIEVVLQDYYQIHDALPANIPTTTATASEAVLASEVSSGASSTGMPLGAKIAAGLLAVGGIAALAGGGGGDDDKNDHSGNNPHTNREPDLDLPDTVSIKENVKGAKIATVKASDPDGDKISYTVSDSRFEVVSGSLKLKDGVALDYEKEPIVSVTVIAKDGHGNQDSETVKIK